VPRAITDAQVEEVVVRTLEEVPDGATHWSKRELARQAGISPSSVQRIWHAFGLQAGRAVTVAHIAAQPLVMPTPGHGLRTLVDRAVAQAQVNVELAVQTNSMNLQKRLVQDGRRWTMLPGAGIAADMASGMLSAAPLSEPEVWRAIVLGMPRTGSITPATQAVARQLARQVQIVAGQERWPSAEIVSAGP
jgi:DNA-binding transcriptional LysR family regulator